MKVLIIVRAYDHVKVGPDKLVRAQLTRVCALVIGYT